MCVADLLDRERDVDSGMAALEEAVNIVSDYKRDYFEQSSTKNVRRSALKADHVLFCYRLLSY